MPLWLVFYPSPASPHLQSTYLENPVLWVGTQAGWSPACGLLCSSLRRGMDEMSSSYDQNWWAGSRGAQSTSAWVPCASCWRVLESLFTVYG